MYPTRASQFVITGSRRGWTDNGFSRTVPLACIASRGSIRQARHFTPEGVLPFLLPELPHNPFHFKKATCSEVLHFLQVSVPVGHARGIGEISVSKILRSKSKASQHWHNAATRWCLLAARLGSRRDNPNQSSRIS